LQRGIERIWLIGWSLVLVIPEEDITAPSSVKEGAVLEPV
jgi:hypothetical protein